MNKYKLDSIDLNLNNYSLDDLYRLFNIDERHLDETSMKNAKQIVLKMHPDKSRLDSKYFFFFSDAYKRLYQVYTFQNQFSKKPEKQKYFANTENQPEHSALINQFFEKNKHLEDPKNFNSWFNKAFEKHRLENPNEEGHGDWLKSNEDFIDMNENVTKSNMNEIFEQKKKQIQSITVYKGVTDSYSSMFGATLLDNSLGSSSDYTDLKEAYTQTLIPITMDDYNNVQKFNNVSEYKMHRETIDITPLSKKEASEKLLYDHMQRKEQSAALAYKYAQQAEKAKEKQNNFWGELKQISG